MKNLNTAFSFAPPSILSLTIYISLIGVYTVFEDREDNPIITLYTILFIIVFASVVILVKANEKVDFFDDVIEIAEKQKELF